MVDVSALLAAILFLASNVMGFVLFLEESDKIHFSISKWKDLDPAYLERDWAWRNDAAPYIHAMNLLHAAAWFVLSGPLVQFAWIQSKGGSRKVWSHAMIVMFAIGGAITELVSGLLVFGAFSTSLWVSREFNLTNWGSTPSSGDDSFGIRTLEICFLLVEGMLDWVDAFQWLLLFVVLFLVYHSVHTVDPSDRLFNRYWTGLGLIIALLSIMDFAADVLRVEEMRTFRGVAAFVSFINTVLFLPIWLVWFSVQLPKATPEFTSEEAAKILFRRSSTGGPPQEETSSSGLL